MRHNSRLKAAIAGGFVVLNAAILMFWTAAMMGGGQADGVVSTADFLGITGVFLLAGAAANAFLGAVSACLYDDFKERSE